MWTLEPGFHVDLGLGSPTKSKEFSKTLVPNFPLRLVWQRVLSCRRSSGLQARKGLRMCVHLPEYERHSPFTSVCLKTMFEFPLLVLKLEFITAGDMFICSRSISKWKFTVINCESNDIGFTRRNASRKMEITRAIPCHWSTDCGSFGYCSQGVHSTCWFEWLRFPILP